MAEIDRSLIGVWGPSSSMKVEFGKIREFAKAVKDPNPIYSDEARCVAPPTFLMTIAHWVGDLGATRSAVKLDFRRLLHGEQDFEYDGKRGGKMLFVIGETEFTNQRGEVVAYMRNTAIETSGAVAG